MIKPFTCPVCNITFELTYVPNRKKCPDCAREWAKIRTAKHHAEKGEIYKARNKAKEQQKKEATMTPQQKMDAEQNARVALMMKQCRKCEYYCNDRGIEYCDYRSWYSHGPTKGDGPGDCRSFLKRGTKTREERIARSRIALARSEADHSYT